MSLDWQSQLLDPIYDVIGVSARITTASTVKDVTVLDKTAGVALAAADNIEIQSIKPAAIVRMSELSANGLSREALDGAQLALNGSSWTIKSTQPRPSPDGEAKGELYLFLEAA